MNVRYYIDKETGFPHIYKHDVREEEVEDVLQKAVEDRPGKENSRIAIGQTRGGRYPRVIYVPDPEPNSVFVITSYELVGKPLKAFRRRGRRRKSHETK
jgi:hypothetical protein